jgi:hypothetical protein
MADSPVQGGFAHYKMIFPRARKGVTEVEVPVRHGKVEPDKYLFGECYCIATDCDCRMVKLQVVTSKLKPVAVIDFPLDIDEDPPPELSPDDKQGAAAPGLLEIFIETLVDHPEWYRDLCKNYRAVRKKVDQKPYQGKRFPNSRYLQWWGEPIEEDDEDFDEEKFFSEMQDLFGGLLKSEQKKSQKKRKVEPLQGTLFPEPKADVQLAELIDAYSGRLSAGLDLGGKRDGQLRNLMHQDQAQEALTTALVASFQSEDDLKLEAVSQILYDWLEILRTDIERRRPDAVEIMDRLQTALAQQVFHPDVDPGLGAEVTRMLLDTRVEILPQLHEANSQRMATMPVPEEMLGANPEEALERMLADFEGAGARSSFELVDMLLQMMAVGDREVQLEFYGHLFFSEHEIAREAAALMVFHPQKEVREGIAELLAGVDGACFSPVMLRRLIIARNWFPENIRKQLDQAINNARRARVECAPLAAPVKVQIYASVMDGANAQSIMALLPRGKGFLGCSVMLKTQHGVADAFILPLEDKYQLKELKQVMLNDTGSTETMKDYLDQRVCQGLADGAAVGKVPTHWLVAIAEQLGNDQWKAIAFDSEQQLQQLQEELTRKKRATVLEANKNKALQSSAQWLKRHAFAGSWFEDDVEVDQLLDKLFSKKPGKSTPDPVAQVIDKILEARRQSWLERLVIATIWLKYAVKPPVPWEQMYHVAVAVADSTIPLQHIPLMRSIAESSIGAYFGRKEDMS